MLVFVIHVPIQLSAFPAAPTSSIMATASPIQNVPKNTLLTLKHSAVLLAQALASHASFHPLIALPAI